MVVAYDEPNAGSLMVVAGGTTRTLASHLASVGEPALVRLPDSSLLLFASEEAGVVSYASHNNGASWTGPAKTSSTDVGDVQAAAARKDGTPLFSQDGTGFVNVYQGAGGETVHNAFPRCSGYAESLAVDSNGLAQIAFWSNASGHGGFLYGKLAANGALAGSLRTLSSGESIPRDQRVPLLADRKGNTFVAFSNGYPTSTAFVVETLRGAAAHHVVTLAKGSFSGPEPLMALAVDQDDRLWAAWTQGGSLWAARSRSSGAHFGAAVHVSLPGTAYQIEAGALPDGSVDAFVNTGSNLQEQKLLPGLTVIPSAGAVRVLDDGFPVAGATVRAAGKSVTTNGTGTANVGALPEHTALAVSAAGYAPATVRTS
jgi:hypothetical protein